LIYSCCNENRRAAVLADPVLNGVDYVEVLDHDALALDSPRQRTLLLHCLKAAPALTPGNVLIQGGESITGITADWVAAATSSPPQANAKELAYFQSLPDAANVVVVRTSKAGDFSTYELRLVNNSVQAQQDPFQLTAALAGFDPQLAAVQFSFKVECGPDFDCAPQPPGCPPTEPTPPGINYLAKDYGSFRTLMLDRLSQLLPWWNGGSEADLGITLAELIAYAGDNLSYQQDAVATEAYFATARSRVSLRRHALLVDYHVHDGANARAWIQLQAAGNPGDQVFLDRSRTRFYTFAPGMPPSLADPQSEEGALLSGVQVFEPMYDAVLYPEHNQMPFYTWGDANCCLPQGAMEATLQGHFPNLQPGDVLIIQEVKGSQTGIAADADIRHRCAVRLTQVVTQDAHGQPLVDPLFKDSGGNPTQVTEVQWGQDDALPFPVCISSTFFDSAADIQSATGVSVVFGNVVLADHGLSLSGRDLGTVPNPTVQLPPNAAADRCQTSPPQWLAVRFRPEVPDSPLTQAVPLPAISLPAAGIPVTAGAVGLNTGVVSLENAAGFSCLTLHTTNTASWPSLFGVTVAINGGNPANIDVSVVYNPPGGAAGLSRQVTVETFTNLSLNPADPSYVKTRINSQSKLIAVPASYVPPVSAPSVLPTAPVMLPATGSVDLKDLSAIAFLTLQPTDPAGWLPLFGVSAPVTAHPPYFDLQVIYTPGSITVEEFSNLSLSTAAQQVNGISDLITVESFAQTADSTLSAYALANFDPRLAVPAIALQSTLNGQSRAWTPMQDLLESGESDDVFVVEVEYTGVAALRFGDDTNGRRPDPGTSFLAQYRIGNGTAGNVGADSLVFLAAADARIQACRNPLPAAGGTDPESMDQIRRRAPQAFLTQERAVTMADYEAVAEANPQVDRAVASLRWTGSWYTVFLAVEPKSGGNLPASLGLTLTAAEERYRLAGQDLELDSPQYVSLQVELEVCVDPDYFKRDVERSLHEVLGGLFRPGNFAFGQTVYLSRIYAAARSVAGVTVVRASKFQPQGADSPQYLAAGEIKLGSLEVARLANDPNYPDHGQLTLVLEGGK